jgi:hypothetical protein
MQSRMAAVAHGSSHELQQSQQSHIMMEAVTHYSSHAWQQRHSVAQCAKPVIFGAPPIQKQLPNFNARNEYLDNACL